MSIRKLSRVSKMRSAGVFVVCLLAASSLMAGTGVAAHMSCPIVIVADTTLTHDLSATPGQDNCVIFGADNIKLSLNGFSILGSPATGDGAGVLTNGHSLVEVVGPGTISGWDAGILIEGVGNLGDPNTGGATGGFNEVKGVTVTGNHGDGSTDYGDGILIAGSSENEIANNTVSDNGPYDGIGLISLAAPAGPLPSVNNKIENNVVADNNVSVGTFNQDVGIRIEPQVTGTRVVGNTVTGSGLDNISMFNTSQDNFVANNYVAGAVRRNGIQGFNSTTADVQGNTVCGNALDGISMGLGLPAQGPSLITNNNVGVGTPGCAANGRFDLFDGYNVAPLNLGEPCGLHIWRGNYTVGDTFNHPCTTNP